MVPSRTRVVTVAATVNPIHGSTRSTPGPNAKTWSQRKNPSQPAASALAVVLLCLLIVPIVIYQQMQMREIERSR